MRYGARVFGLRRMAQMESEFIAQRGAASVDQANRAAKPQPGYPSAFEASRGKRVSERAGKVIPPFAPIQAKARKRPPVAP
jgi:hypothetical protein